MNHVKTQCQSMLWVLIEKVGQETGRPWPTHASIIMHIILASLRQHMAQLTHLAGLVAYRC